jgi:eukaryotic-like serine/threonine-protein kinase
LAKRIPSWSRISSTPPVTVFDGTLKKALAVDLQQSPFLNIVSDQQVQKTLKFMGRSPDDAITKNIGREICQRDGIKAMLTGSIALVGSQYLITLILKQAKAEYAKLQ